MLYIQNSGDNGLLMAMLESETAWNVLNGDLSAYKGAIAENMVAATFNSLDKPVYYYREASGSPELDFVFNDQGNISIIECKSVNDKCTSMRYLLSKPKKYGEHKGIKIADSRFGVIRREVQNRTMLSTIWTKAKKHRRICATV